jgi:hypothetical protein
MRRDKTMKKKPIECLARPLPSEPYSLDGNDPEVVFACLLALALVLSTPVGSEIFRALARDYEMLALDDQQDIRRYTELCEKRPSWEREQLCIHLSELGARIRCQFRILYDLVTETSGMKRGRLVLDRVIENELIEYNRY